MVNVRFKEKRKKLRQKNIVQISWAKQAHNHIVI